MFDEDFDLLYQEWKKKQIENYEEHLKENEQEEQRQ